MICPKCNSETKEGASYCGNCGTALFQEDERYTVYNYHRKFARENGASTSFGSIYGKAMLIMVPAILAAVICPFLGEEMWVWLGIPLSVTLLSLGGVIGMTVSKAPYFNAAQQAIVLDRENQKYYLVRFHGNQISGWDTASRAAAALYNAGVREEETRKAQMDAFCIQVVSEYQEGQHQPSAARKFFVGSELTIIELNDLEVTKKTKKATICAYTNKKGRRKNILIPNAYPDFQI